MVKEECNEQFLCQETSSTMGVTVQIMWTKTVAIACLMTQKLSSFFFASACSEHCVQSLGITCRTNCTRKKESLFHHIHFVTTGQPKDCFAEVMRV